MDQINKSDYLALIKSRGSLVVQILTTVATLNACCFPFPESGGASLAPMLCLPQLRLQP